MLRQGDEVLPPHLPAGHCPEHPQDVQFVVQPPDQAVDAHVPGPGAESRQALQEVPAPRVIAGLQGLVEVPGAVAAPDEGQVVGSEAEEGRAENGDEGHVLLGVVQNLEQGVNHRHLHGGEEVLALLGAAGDAPLRQGPGIVAQPGARGPQKHHDVLRAAGAELAGIAVGNGVALIKQPPDALRHEPGLRQGTAEGDVLLPPALWEGQQVKLRLAVLPGRQEGGAEVEPLPFPVVHLPHFPGHDGLKDEVHPVQHRLAGAEVLAEEDLPGLALLRLVRQGIGLVLLQEDGRVRQAEAVDGLLHVPHGEEGPPAVGDGGEDAVLHLVGVLVLVHHHLPVPLGHGVGQLGGGPVLSQEEADGVVLLVCEIRGVPPQLLPAAGPVEGHGQVQQGLHGRGGPAQVLRRLGGGHVQDGPGGVHLLLAPGPQALQAVPQFRGLALSRRPQPGPVQGDGPRPVPADFSGLRQLPEHPGPLLKSWAIGLPDGLVPGHPVQALGQEGRPVPGLPGHGGEKLPAIGRLPHVLRKAGPALPLLRQPPLRVGVALDLSVEIQHQVLQAAVVPAEAEGVRQLGPAGGQPGVELLQHPRQDPPPQEGGLPLVQHPEVRRQPPVPAEVQQMDVLPDQGGTEGVDGLDVRLVDQRQLALEVPVPGAVGHPGGQLPGDPLPELGGGGPGVGDDEEVVHIGPLRAQYPAEEAVHQHAGLAAAGGGGDQEAPPLIVHHRLLVPCQLHAHVRSSSPITWSTCRQKSSGFTGRISSMWSPSSPCMK